MDSSPQDLCGIGLMVGQLAGQLSMTAMIGVSIQGLTVLAKLTFYN